MGEQFCLRWNNHQSTLVSVFENLLDSGTLIDCTLYADGQLLRAHKVVLTACSPIFESMLKVQEDKHPIIFLKDVKFVEMKAMLDYMYKGEVNILQDNLDSFLKTAAALEIKGLTDQGGGGEGEPPAKKGPGRKTGMSDVAPESPLVGNAPLRDGSISPSSRKRRRQRRPSPTPDDHSADNSCDIPALPATPIATPAAPQMTNPTSTPMNDSRLLTVKKQEPLDTPIIQPKTEYMEEPSEDIEDLTIDDDDDYGDMSSDMSRPGTSYGMSQGGSQADLTNWQNMMATDRLGQDEVFNAANEAINSQANTQGEKKKKNVEKYIKIGPSPKKNEVNSSAATKASVLPKSSLLLPKKDKEVTKIEKPSQRSTQLSKLNEKKSILNQLKEKEDNFVVLRPKVISKDLKEKEEKLIVHRPKTILKELKEEENFIVLGPKERTKVVQDNSNLSFLTRKTSLKEIEKLHVKSFVQTDGNVVLTKNTNKQIGSEQNIVVLEENASNDEMFLDINHFMLQDSYDPTPKVPKTEKELKSSLAPFLKVKDKKKNLLTQVMSSAKVPDAQFLNIATKSGLHGKRIQVKSIVNQNGETVYFDKDGFSYLLNSSTNVSKSLKCFMFSEGCSAKAILYEKDKEFIYLKDDHNHESDFTETF